MPHPEKVKHYRYHQHTTRASCTCIISQVAVPCQRERTVFPMLDKIISLTVLAAESAGIVWLWKFTHRPPKRYVDIAPLLRDIGIGDAESLTFSEQKTKTLQNQHLQGFISYLRVFLKQDDTRISCIFLIFSFSSRYKVTELINAIHHSAPYRNDRKHVLLLLYPDSLVEIQLQ